MPKYREIYEDLSRDILAGRYEPGYKFPSEAALVKRYGASRITVGHALRELQEHGLVDRVAGSGTYVRAVGGRAGESLLFGLIIPNLGETEIFEPICRAIAASPEARGHALLWPHAAAGNRDKGGEALRLCEQCIARKVSGVFFAPLELDERSGEINRKVLRLLKDAAIPVVLLDRRPTGELADRERCCDLVGIDNHRAGYIAADHLRRLGAKNVGFVACRNQASTVKERIRGYRDALGDAPARILYVDPDGAIDVGDADALVCANDRLAGHVMHALLARGRRIPQDVRIVGIDDVTYAGLLPVPLTTVHQPCREIGQTALRVMMERLDRPKMPARDVLLDCGLMVRQSCGIAGRKPGGGAEATTPHT